MRKIDKKLIICADLFGCPNRCKHCYLGHNINRKMEDNADQFIVDFFKPFFDKIVFYSWAREPDYTDDYENRWIKDNEISVNSKPLRFELASFYRLARDTNYARFLNRVGVKVVQLSFFGLEESTDYYVGRKGAWNELFKAVEILLSSGIAPRFQVFINKDNSNEIIELLKITRKMKLKKRCESIGQEFKFFIHSGSCDGENFKLYPNRINKQDVPKALIPYYWKFDETYKESELIELLSNDDSTISFLIEDSITLYVSNNYDVYFNYTELTPKWCIGNLRRDTREKIIENILNQNVEAINVARKTPISSLVKRYGDKKSDKIFFKRDYIEYLLLKHLK